MNEPDFAILLDAANRCVADRLGAAVAKVGGEAMETELRERFGDEAVGHLRTMLIEFVERHGGAEELAANR